MAQVANTDIYDFLPRFIILKYLRYLKKVGLIQLNELKYQHITFEYILKTAKNESST